MVEEKFRNEYVQYAREKLEKKKFSELSSWCLVFPFLQNKRTLDLGCSDGLYLKHLTKDSVGVEFVPELVQAARKKGLNVIEGDVIEVLKQLDCNSFEAVLMSHILEHLECPLVALREAYRVLHVGGVLVLGLPLESNLFRQVLRMDYFGGTHLYSFSIRNILKLLEYTNFEVIKVFFHIPIKGKYGCVANKIWNLLPIPGKEWLSFAYWIVAIKRRR